MPRVEKTARRGPGRPATGRKVAKYTVALPPDLHEWAMQHPEGFSGLTRRLLSEQQRKEEAAHTDQ